MKFLERNSDTKLLEKEVKNKWRWEWLDETDSLGQKYGEWLKKPDAMGMAFCDACGKTISYKSSGKKALRLHSEDSNHRKNLRTVKSNQVLPGSSKSKSTAGASMIERTAQIRAVTVAFLSEWCLPFSLAENLLNYAKRVSEDMAALQKTTISRTSASYITTHGVATCFKEELKQKLKTKDLSLNIDEATNNNNDKILNVIVQYFDTDSDRVVVDHLGSRKQNQATAANILESVENVLQEYEIGWNQIVSVLMDNCSTMRGVKGGVEALIREKNPSLMDISGDTVHMVNNVSKTILNQVDSTVQDLCSDIYYDIEESPKVRSIFQEVQGLLNNGHVKQIIRPISSRFLQMLDVCDRVVDLSDSLTVYYYSFLSEYEKATYSFIRRKLLRRDKLDAIYSERNVSEEAQAAITLLQMSQEEQQKSASSNNRKDRIISQLFENRHETFIKINLFRGILEKFHGYVKVFQSEKPLVHTLHREMYSITREVFGMFIKPENIPESVKELLKLDVSDESLQKSDKELQVGRYAYVDMNKARLEKKNHHWLRTLYTDLRAGYVAGAQKLLKMPLGNQSLRKLSVLDPHLANHNQASKSIMALATSLPNVINESKRGSLAVEVDKYTTDSQVREFASSFCENEMRIDVDFWSKVFSLKTFNEPRYPQLKKLISALLSIFSGPLVESTFNIMDDIVEKDRSKLTIENYEAVAIIKTTLKRKKVSAVSMVVSANMKKSCIKAYATYQQFLVKKKEAAEKKRDEKLKASVLLLKKEKAKRIAKLVRLKNRRLEREAGKRQNENSDRSGRPRWKRIKLA